MILKALYNEWGFFCMTFWHHCASKRIFLFCFQILYVNYRQTTNINFKLHTCVVSICENRSVLPMQHTLNFSCCFQLVSDNYSKIY